MSKALDLVTTTMTARLVELYKEEHPENMYDQVMHIDTTGGYAASLMRMGVGVRGDSRKLAPNGDVEMMDMNLNSQVIISEAGGLGCSWSWDEIGMAEETKIPLSTVLLEEVYAQCYRGINQGMLMGNLDIGGTRTGLYNNADVDKSSQGIDFESLIAADNLNGVVKIFKDAILKIQKGTLQNVDTIIFPSLASFGGLMTKKDNSVLELIKQAFPMINIVEDLKLLTAGTNGKPRIVVKSDNKKVVEGLLPLAPFFRPPAETSTKITSAAVYKSAGCAVYQPKGIVYIDTVDIL